MEKLIFKKIDGSEIDSVEKYVKNWTKENPYGQIIIGCDSQVHGRRIKYSVVICMHYQDKTGQGHGAHVLIANVWEKRLINKSQIEEMPTKLWREAEYVLIAAQMVDGADEIFKKRITIHLDYSSNKNDKSNTLFDAGIGYLSSMGYHAEGKPLSWAATHTADNFCR